MAGRACLNDDPDGPPFWEGRIGVFCDSAPLPLEMADDYTGVELELPGFYDEVTGELDLGVIMLLRIGR